MSSLPAKLPDDVLVVEDFLDSDTMAKLNHYADGEIGIINKIGVVRPDGRLGVKRVDGFSSDRIYLRGIDALAKSICNKVFGEVIPQRYGAEIEWYEYPHIIRYREGGEYRAHSDADNWDPEAEQWVRGIDRDYSAIIYINDGFEGGGLHFPQYDVRIMPKPGLLVCFPSDGRFVHTAEPVTRGVRYAMVTWAAAMGSQRSLKEQTGEFVYMREQRA